MNKKRTFEITFIVSDKLTDNFSNETVREVIRNIVLSGIMLPESMEKVIKLDTIKEVK